MDKLNRRKFLKVAGASTAVVAGVSVPSADLLANNTTKKGTLTFRAVAGLPAKPLPSYASYVLEGHVDLTSGSGVMTKTVFAGSPGKARNLVRLLIAQVASSEQSSSARKFLYF